MREHPELILWEYCENKVYPISDATNTDNWIPCNCKQFIVEKQQIERKSDKITSHTFLGILRLYFFILAMIESTNINLFFGNDSYITHTITKTKQQKNT